MDTDNQAMQAQLNLNQNMPILYTDAVYISVSDFGLVFDIAQTAASTNQQMVVARIGMSKEHARKLAEAINKRLKEQESDTHRIDQEEQLS